MKMDDTIFLFLCILLVWLMTPGLSLFYGGLVQSKNVLNTVMQSMAAIIIVTFTWVVIGFSLSFGHGNDWIGNFDFIGLQHVGFNTNVQFSPHIPFALFMLFQMMFCTIAVSILSGSIAERMRFIPFTIFIFIWVIMIYSPVAHWVCFRLCWRYRSTYYIGSIRISISNNDRSRKKSRETTAE